MTAEDRRVIMDVVIILRREQARATDGKVKWWLERIMVDLLKEVASN